MSLSADLLNTNQSWKVFLVHIYNIDYILFMKEFNIAIITVSIAEMIKQINQFIKETNIDANHMIKTRK